MDVRPSLALLVVAVLAGCLAPGAVPRAPADGGPIAIPFEMRACTFAVAVLPVDVAKLAPRLPAGFVAVVSPGPTGDQATLGLEAFECGDAGARYAYGSVFAPAMPPASLAADAFGETYVKWTTLVSDASTRATLAAAGFPATNGTVSLRVGAAPAGTVDVRVLFDRAGGFEAHGAGTTTGPRKGFDYVEFMPDGAGALAAWRSHALDRPSVVQARGMVTVDPSSWYASITGPGPLPATVVAGEWSFAPGNITFPVRTVADVR